jgi:transglutaminase-like putative cysteine protease
VSSRIDFQVAEDATVVLLVAASADERRPEIPSRALGRDLGDGQFLVEAPEGELTISYTADVPASTRPSGVTDLERVVAMRPSRYCPSDRLAGYAESRFSRYPGKIDRVKAICDHVYRHLVYEAGSSDAHTDAADTLLSGRGVCRDYAHLAATLCRAVDVPARVASVYAPGLSPMDFHLVVETALDGEWRVWDATRLAPRQSLVRIATGRDAADVAFATVMSGRAELTSLDIVAVADGDLPLDDHEGLVSLG